MSTKEKRRRPPASAAQKPRRKAPVRRERRLRDQDVVYTPPKPFKRGRFLLSLATVAAVVLAVVFGMSIFFKVDKIQVSGGSKYSAWEVSEASGVEMGSNLLSVSRAGVSGSVISRLPYVDMVRVGIILPDTVNIEITELDVVYAVEDHQGGWWLMNSEGKVVDETNGVTAKSYTQVLGVRLQDPAVGQQAVAVEAELPTIPLEIPEEVPQESTLPQETAAEEAGGLGGIPVGITGAQQMQTAMTVLQELSGNSLTAMVDSVDVTKTDAITLWYDERFKINLGDATRLDYKLSALKATVNKMESYESGDLDVSFTNWPDKVGYTPFA